MNPIASNGLGKDWYIPWNISESTC